MSTATAEAPSTGLIQSNGQNGHGGNGQMSIYDRIADPLDFVNQMGKVFAKAGACGVSTEAEGQLLALACACEKKTPFEIGRRFHIMDGKLVLKSDVMLSDFGQAGGTHKWLKDGSDGIEAVLWIKRPDGEVMTSSYSITDAQAAELIRPKSNWTKGPKAVGQMLRARATSNGIRMLMPGIVAGVYTPEEISDEVGAREVKPVRSRVEVEKRREDLRSAAAAAETVIEAEVSPAVAAIEEAPFEGQQVHQEPQQATTSQPETRDPNYNEHSTVLLEIEATIGQIGLTKEQLVAGLKAKNPEFNSLDDLPLEKAKAVLENLRAAVPKK